MIKCQFLTIIGPSFKGGQNPENQFYIRCIMHQAPKRVLSETTSYVEPWQRVMARVVIKRIKP